MSKLRVDQFVNSDDNGAPSFPNSATTIQPTESDQFATKQYADMSLGSISPITNTISPTEPPNPSIGDFWTDISDLTLITLSVWDGSNWINLKSTQENPNTQSPAGSIISPPSISDPNGGYIPTMLTATSAVVSDAILSSSKWYKDDVEIPGSSGSLQFYATEIGTYKYEEIWVDTFGTQLFPSLSAVIDARAGVIDAQPTITSSNGVYSPTILTATAAVVSNATLVGSRWYKDGVEIPDSSGLSINIPESDGGIYKYEETWTDYFGNQLLPTLSASVQVFATIADPTVLTPADGTGSIDFNYTAESSAITDITTVDALGDDPAFSTTLYSGNGDGGINGQSINTSIDNASESLVWIKARTGTGAAYLDHCLFDTLRGPENIIRANDPGSTLLDINSLLSFDADGYTTGGSGLTNVSGNNYVAWNFSAEPGFLDIVEWNASDLTTGDYMIDHNLGTTPGMIICKNIDNGGASWYVYHKDATSSSYSDPNAHFLYLNQTREAIWSSGMSDPNSDFGGWAVTDTQFRASGSLGLDNGSDNFIAYVFADNPTNEIKCGSYTGAGGYSASAPETVTEVNVGFQPRWMMIKRTDSGGNWVILDENMSNTYLKANSTDQEGGVIWNFTSTGVRLVGAWDSLNHPGGEYSYVAIGSPKVTVSNTQLTLTDTTVSKVSDGSLVGGVSIDQALTAGDVVRPLGSKSSWVVETDTYEAANGIDHDSNGNVYVAHTGSGVGVSKFDADGVLQWKKIFSAGIYENVYNLKVDNSDNIIVTQSHIYGSNGQRFGVFKINPSGDILWSKNIDNSTARTANEVPDAGLYIDASDNIYVSGYSNLDVGGGNTYQFYWIKLSSSGDLLIDRYLRKGGGIKIYGKDVAVDNSGNIYISGYGSSFGDNGDVIVAKYNSSGDYQWSRAISSPNNDNVGFMATDGTYLYVNVNNFVGSDPSTSIVKLNSSGNIVWQRKITASGASNLSVNDVDTDSAGNIYVTGYKGPRLGQSNGVDGFYAKWNSSGVLQWQRYITSDANQYPAHRMSLDDSGNIHICGRNYHTGTMTLMVAKIPEDGSLTGTHGSYTFGDTNYTEGPASFDSNYASLGSENESLFLRNVPRTASDSSDTHTTTSFGTSGIVEASAGNTIILSDVSGTWSTGMKVQGDAIDVRDYPDPVNPNSILFTSSEPATTQGSVATWGNAQWQVAEDSGFTTNIQSLTSALTSSGTQTGPTGFTLDYNKNYYVRTKYGSSNPSGVFSNWSVANLFKTGSVPRYVDDLFNMFLYTGNGGTNNIVNGIDLAGEGGLVWNKDRTYGATHSLWDTERGATKFISTNDYNRELEYSNSLTSFNSDGFSLGSYHIPNRSVDYISWTFRKAPGFFDIVTYNGDGVSGRSISHNLGSAPGMILVKRTDASGNWLVYHRSQGISNYAWLDLDNKFNSGNDNHWGSSSSEPTSTSFQVGNGSYVNAIGGTYVAYLFAHDDQSFGTTGAESVIKCGSWTTDSSTGDIPEVDLGWEPQYMLWKSAATTGDWYISDTARGWLGGSPQGGGSFNSFKANKDSKESHASGGITNNGSGPLLTSTGFVGDGANWGANQTYIYMAIRRPHKPATSATEVFNPVTYTGTGSSFTYNNGFPLDLVWHTQRGISYNGTSTSTWIYDRLRGTNQRLITSSTGDEGSANFIDFDKQNSVGINGSSNGFNFGNQLYYDSEEYIQHVFRRAPGFMDMVTWTGNGAQGRSISHNLGVAPELIIVKCRSNDNGWPTWHKSGTNDSTYGRKTLMLNTDAAESLTGWFTATEPTSTVFNLSSNNQINSSFGFTYIAYLFSSQPGVSKVGSYSGTGGDIDVDCGFAAGARFVLIKRTDSNGDWYVWDSARAIVSDNEPYLLLNETGSEVTNTDYIDPLNAGFTVTSSAPAALNAIGGTYLFLAIA